MRKKGSLIFDRKQCDWIYTKWCEGYTQMQIAEAMDCCVKAVRIAINGRPRIRPILVYDGDKTM